MLFNRRQMSLCLLNVSKSKKMDVRYSDGDHEMKLGFVAVFVLITMIILFIFYSHESCHCHCHGTYVLQQNRIYVVSALTLRMIFPIIRELYNCQRNQIEKLQVQ